MAVKEHLRKYVRKGGDMLADKDATEKRLEDYADVFSDLVNVLLFKGKQLMQPEDLLTALPRSIYKVDGKMHEQERDVAKFWKKGQIRIAFIGLENQTDIEADIPFRIIGYDGAVYRDQLNADEKDKPKERYPVVTLVLYFGYERRWNKPLNLKECFSIPEELEPFVNDYHVNLFEIAWLPDETIAMFQSDFRFVAEYFSQKRKNQQYKAPAGEMKHVRAVLELLSAVMQDTRFMDAYNGCVAEGRPTNMDPWLDEIENRGREEGREEGKSEMVLEMLREKQPVDLIAKVSKFSLEKIAELGRLHGVL